MLVRIGIICLLICTICSDGHSQALRVADILVTGNKRTKEFTILRELDFSEGDTLTQKHLAARLERNRSNLLNMGLFTEVEVNITEWDTESGQIFIAIHVSEAWGLYLIPILELADRNINVWWTEHNAALNRLNLGLRVYHINLTGVRDRLKFKGQLGYTRLLEVDYDLPYFNKKRTLGLLFEVIWTANREVAYTSIDNKEEFYKDLDNKDVFGRFQVQVGMSYRPNLYMYQQLEFGYHNNWIADQIAQDYNPDFFLDGRSRQEYFGFRYQITYDKRNLRLFPTSGVLAGLELVKDGFSVFDDINTLNIYPNIEYYYPISERLSIGTQAKVKYEFIRKKQPMYNYKGLGYGANYVRGYELYIINGQDYAYGKFNFNTLLVDTRVNWKKVLPRAFRDMAVEIFGSLNFDIGYVNDPYYEEQNPLVNRFLCGGGPAINLLLYHNFAIQVEYNFNNNGENGLFLHMNTSF